MGLEMLPQLILYILINIGPGNMILLRSSFKYLPRCLITNQLNMGFSEYFRQKDIQDLWDYNDRKIINHKYRSLVNLWKRPLEKKRLRQARIKQIKASLPEPQQDSQKLVIHNPALGLKTPAPEDIYAVVKVDNRQYKVTKDCMIILDTKPTHEINQQIKFEQVLLIGTQTYTSIGRPIISNATVEGTVESISRSEKILVFKKKRRKQYKKSQGSRAPLTTVRITNIVHSLTSQILGKAVALQ